MRYNIIFKILLCTSLILNSQVLNSQVLTLDSCLSLARKNNVDIRTSQLDIEKAREVKEQVYTKYFPQVQLSALGYYSANPLLSFGIEDVQSSDMREILEALYESVNSAGSDIKNEVTLMKKGATGSLTLAQPIYAGGRIVTGNRLAELGVEAAELQSEMKIRDVIENIESSYYLVVALQQKETTIAAALELIDSLDRTVQSALANGLVTRSDALQIQLKRNEMLANQQQLVSGIRLSKRLLCCQIGIEYSDALVFADPSLSAPPLLSFSYATMADTLRPEARLLKLSVEAEELNRRMTLGEALPQITLIGSAYYGNLMKENPTGNAVALLSLSVPLTGWWETSHKLRQHDLRIAEAHMKQDYMNRMMSLEEEKAYSDMVDAYMLLKSDSTALDVAKENYRLANLNYSAGVAMLSEVLQAHTLLLQAQNAITDRRTTYIMARRRLLDLQRSQNEN